MRIFVGVMWLVVVTSAAPLLREERVCRDQYGHCPEWGGAGFCKKTGYKEYMTLMCSYTCNTCDEVVDEPNASGEEDEASASGLADIEPEASSPTNETTTSSDHESVISKQSSDGETNQDDETQTKDVSKENSAPEHQPTNEITASHDHESVIPKQSSGGEPNQDEETQTKDASKENRVPEHQKTIIPTQKTTSISQDRDLPGVRKVVMEESTDDEVNPRSKISTVPKEIAPGVEASAPNDAEEISEEMKDIAGDVISGSQIFEPDIAEPESTSGCSSGFGCSSGNGEQVVQGEEELESRSKIDRPQKIASVHSGVEKSEETSSNDEKEDQIHSINVQTVDQDIEKGSHDDLSDSNSHEQQTIDGSSGDHGESIDSKEIQVESSGSDDFTHSKSTEQPESIDVHDKSVDESGVRKSAVETPNRDDLSESIDTETSSIDQEKDIDQQGARKSSVEKPSIDTDNLSIDKKELQQSETIGTKPTNNDDQDAQKSSETSGSGESLSAQPLPLIDDSSNDIGASGVEENPKENSSSESDSIDAVKKPHSIDESSRKQHDEDALKTSLETVSSGDVPTDSSKDSPKSSESSGSGELEDDDDMEDALFAKEIEEDAKKNKDLSSLKAKQRLTSMEKLIDDQMLKPQTPQDKSAKARGDVPHKQEKVLDMNIADSEIGKGKRMALILDQHYYKPYSNEDSMAYEMLALDLKKEVERAAGGQAFVSQISFSEVQKPGKLPRYSHVLAKFTLHGNQQALQQAVHKGYVGEMMVDKNFFKSSP